MISYVLNETRGFVIQCIFGYLKKSQYADILYFQLNQKQKNQITETVILDAGKELMYTLKVARLLVLYNILLCTYITNVILKIKKPKMQIKKNDEKQMKFITNNVQKYIIKYCPIFDKNKIFK